VSAYFAISTTIKGSTSNNPSQSISRHLLEPISQQVAIFLEPSSI